MDLSQAEVESWDDDGSVTDDYWERAQRRLATAIALAQQGTELLLKARIADVSPYLLIAGSPREWPKGCDTKDVPFSSFRTIDAQDLLRAHDCIAKSRLPLSFRQNVERMRVLRNTVFHSVDKSRRFAADGVLIAVLESHESLVLGRTWTNTRKRHLDEAPGGWLRDLTAEFIVAQELATAIKLLSPADCKRLLKIEKKVRFYHCPGCANRDMDLTDHERIAQLRPNGPSSKAVYCFACEASREVERRKCTNCKGNVLDVELEVCLSCGASSD
jgi:hypothetical protein